MAAVLAAGLCACGGGSGEGLDENGQPLAAGAGAAPLAPTLASIQAQVFTPSCAVAGCHGGTVVQQGLRLEPGFSADGLINVASAQDATLVRVIPGNPGASFLMQKLEGTQSVGVRMPAFSPPLAQTTIDVIRQWIQSGAPR
jgi:hypothetical protein